MRSRTADFICDRCGFDLDSPNHDLGCSYESGVNHKFIREFEQEHGHKPWLICGYESECFLEPTVEGRSDQEHPSSPEE